MYQGCNGTYIHPRPSRARGRTENTCPPGSLELQAARQSATCHAGPTEPIGARPRRSNDGERRRLACRFIFYSVITLQDVPATSGRGCMTPGGANGKSHYFFFFFELVRNHDVRVRLHPRRFRVRAGGFTSSHTNAVFLFLSLQPLHYIFFF